MRLMQSYTAAEPPDHCVPAAATHRFESAAFSPSALDSAAEGRALGALDDVAAPVL